MTVGSGHEPAGDAMAAGRCAIGGSCAMERCAMGRELCHWERAVLVGDLPWRDAMGRFKKTGPKKLYESELSPSILWSSRTTVVGEAAPPSRGRRRRLLA